MEFTEFLKAIKGLEVSTAGATARTTEDLEAIQTRRGIIWAVVKEFPVEVLEAAIINLCKDPEVKFFPPTPKIYQACVEANEEVNHVPKKILRARFKSQEHVCAVENPVRSLALGMLATLSAYEAAHILCPADVMATCPRCGARRMVTGVFDKIMEVNPEETRNWTPNFKGLMTCEKCETASTSHTR